MDVITHPFFKLIYVSKRAPEDTDVLIHMKLSFVLYIWVWGEVI